MILCWGGRFGVGMAGRIPWWPNRIWCSTPPEPVKVVLAERAAGLVPVDDSKDRAGGSGRQLNEPISSRRTSTRPSSAKRVDTISDSGAESPPRRGGPVNRFLRPAGQAMGNDGVGADLLARARRWRLDPSQNGKLIGGAGLPLKLFGGRMQQYFTNIRARRRTSTASSEPVQQQDELLMDNARSTPSGPTCGRRWAGSNR